MTDSGDALPLLTNTRIRELLLTHGLSASRALGQNFLTDPNTARRIAALADVAPGDHVLEVGPGLGSLTLALLETGARVVAVEQDRHLMAVLAETVGDRARVVHGDVREVDLDTVLEDAPYTLVANLPYNLATTLIIDLLEGLPRIRSGVVMVQREVAERLAAPLPSRHAGIPTVKVANLANVHLVGVVPPSVFHPRPKVTSALLRFERRDAPVLDVGAGELDRVLRAAFGQRRKMLRRSCAGLLTVDELVRAGIDPESRPEQLDLAAWGRLAEAAARPNPPR